MLARLLTPEAFGTYKQFFLIAATLQLTGQLGLTQSLYYFLPRGGKERGAYVAQTFLSLAVLGRALRRRAVAGAPLIGRWLGDGTLATLRTPLGAVRRRSCCAAAPLEGALIGEGRIGGRRSPTSSPTACAPPRSILGAKYGGPAGCSGRRR